MTVSGGGSARVPAPPAPDRPLLLPLLLGLAVLVALVAGTRGAPPPPPGPDCGEACVDGDPLVVGAALPLSGVLAPFGAAQERGVAEAVERVNDAGGVQVGGQRRRVELLVRDSRSLPEVAGQQALGLARGPFGVVALIGPCAPPVAMVRVAELRELPLVTGCQPLPPVGPQDKDHVWQVAAEEDDRARAVLAALRPAQDRRLALFLSNDRSGNAYVRAAAQVGFEAVDIYRPQGREWAPAVAAAASAAEGASGAPVVVAITQPPEGIELWRELAAQGVRPARAYASEAGAGSAWYAAVGPAGDGTLTDAVGRLPAEGGGPAAVDDAVAAVSAELTEVLLDGLSRAASSDRDDVNTGVAQATGAVNGFPVRFREDGTSRVPYRLARWQDGELVPVPPAP